MDKECSIVRDILPLYLENKVRKDTASFVEDHLEKCAECSAEYDKLQTEVQIGNFNPESIRQRQENHPAQVQIEKRIRKTDIIKIGISSVCVAVVILLLYFFPVYRIAKVGGTSYYNKNEVLMLASIGSGKDRAAAQSILRQADAAFNDCQHTHEENQELYGPLARYATNSVMGALFANHSLKLWSAHLDDAEGYLWVFYSHEAFDEQGNMVSGSWNIPSLWKVAKDASGRWIVTSVKEHP